jgi:subtilisin family serine protease
MTRLKWFCAGMSVFVATSAAAQVDIGIGVGRSDRPGDSNNGVAAAGVSLVFGALSARQKLEARDAAIPLASAADVVFVLEDAALDPARIAATTGVSVIEVVPLGSVGLIMVVAALPPGDTPALAQARLGTVPGVIWAQPNHLFQAMAGGKPLPKRFALHRVPPDGLGRITGTIAMIDSPVDLTHEALRGAAIREVAGAAKAVPSAHGTAIASLLVGSGQVPGMARGAQLVSFPAFTDQAKGPALSQTRALARALDSAVLLRPDVLNLSFGGPEDRLLARLLDAAQARGICVAAAAGNGGKTGTVPFPASHPASLAVTAVDEKLRVYRSATPGLRIDVAGVGVNLLAAVPRGYRAVSGTSFATAIVAGAALRLPACTGLRESSSFRAAAAATAQDLGAPGKDAIFGAGLFQLGQ